MVMPKLNFLAISDHDWYGQRTNVSPSWRFSITPLHKKSEVNLTWHPISPLNPISPLHYPSTMITRLSISAKSISGKALLRGKLLTAEILLLTS